MIPIKQQINVINALTKQSLTASYDKKAIDYLVTRELVLQSFLDDLNKNSYIVSQKSIFWELIGDKDG